MKLKTGLLLLASVFLLNSLMAQTVEQGRKFLYYERFKSAKETFQKVLAANPNNEEAAYWLGQSMILPDDRTAQDLSEAKSLYQSKLSANPNSALLIAGIGHIELIEGKPQDARNHFEAAISLSQGKSIPVLNAVGFANGNPDSKNGDPAYAIDKLKQATQIKKFNDPEVLVNLGDAYRKAGDGGNAVISYQAALAIDPKYARAHYRMGRLYQSQGKGQESVYLPFFDDAIRDDPSYAPVYNNLFNYYYETNVPRAAEYFEKWLANSDDDPKACFYRASVKYAQGLFQEAVSKADECIMAGGNTPYPNLFGLKALAYNRLKDSIKAKDSYDEYFRRQSPDKIGSGDLSQYALLLLKFPGNEIQAGELVDKAVALDSVEENKVSYLKAMATAYQAQKKFKESGDWFAKILTVKKNIRKTDLYYAGYDYFRSTAFDSSIKVFTQYITKFPEDIFGYYMIAKASAGIDSTGELGLAVPFYQKSLEMGESEADKTKVKDQLMGAYKFFIEYYYNVKKDQATALTYVEKAILLDPTDEQLNANKEFIMKNDPKAAPKKPNTPRPPTTPNPPAKPKPAGTAPKN